MKRVLSFAVAALLSFGYAGAQITWDVEHLADVRARLSASDFYSLAYESLQSEADALLDVEPLSVMQKDKTPAGGDKHDYVSLARYFWPDPTKPDGLPYINRDGVSNPELERYDRNRLGQTAERIATLSLAWYLSGNEDYARKAVKLIRVWFLDKETRMNPNLEYAQMVPGVNGGKGRSYGVLDAYSFVDMLNGVTLLEQSDAFTKKDIQGLKSWFRQLTKWMLTSPQGREEAEAANNHSVAYDAQVMAFALYCGDTKTADRIAGEFGERRIMRQIEADGRQPHELTRTLAFGYSEYNLAHIIDVLTMRVGRIAPEARSRFIKAADFLAAYSGKRVEEWPYSQISGWDGKQQELCRDLYRTAIYIAPERTDYLRLFDKTRRMDMTDRFWLLYYRPTDTDEAMAYAQRRLRTAIALTEKAKNEPENAAKRKVTPRTMDGEGRLVLVHPNDWCSGFFAGSLWQIYQYAGTDYWRQEAVTYTWPIESVKWHRGSHDLGFIINDSFGKAYELTGERSYRDVVLTGAKTLITRYSDRVGCIRSWDHNADKWKYPVIIDNMMNLEMLFRATQLTGDSTYWKIAVSHADKTMANHFRGDLSSYHVVDYDPQDGSVRMKCTAQGYADDSFWSRGQSWGVYGYTMCYRFTHDPKYLDRAKGIAAFIMSLPMPDDLIPYWDMKAPDIPDAPRDASAAAVTASALYELSDYVDKATAERYRDYADRIVKSLNSAAYHYADGEGAGFLLRHSTGHYPAGSEIDVPLNYADYYYLEALMRQAARR